MPLCLQSDTACASQAQEVGKDAWVMPITAVPEPHASDLISLTVLCVQSGQCGLGARPSENDGLLGLLEKGHLK